VTLDMRLQRADLEVAVHGPSTPTLFGQTFGKGEMEVRGFIVESQVIVGETVSVAVDAIDRVSSNSPEPCRGRAITSPKPAMDAQTA